MIDLTLNDEQKIIKKIKKAKFPISDAVGFYINKEKAGQNREGIIDALKLRFTSCREKEDRLAGIVARRRAKEMKKSQSKRKQTRRSTP